MTGINGIRSVRVISVLLIALGVAFSVAACGSSSTEPTKTKDVASDGTVTVVQGTDATTLDEPLSGDQPTANILANMYDGLVTIDPADPGPAPQLALSWKRENDTTWEFKLRPGVKFHNGEPFNADAVKFNYDRVLNPPKGSQQSVPTELAVITEVVVVDDMTVNLITKEPSPTLPVRLAGQYAKMVAPKYFQEKGGKYFATHPVGTGPFKFVQWVPGDRLVFEANPDYWGGAPKIKTLIFKPTPEASARLASLQTGAAQLAVDLDPDQAATVESDDSLSLLASPSAFSIFFGMNQLRPGPLQDERVRQAFNYAVNREAIVENLLKGYAKVSAGPLTPEVFAYNESLQPYAYDPDKARALLAEAGYPKDFKLPLNAPTGRYSADRLVAQAVAADLKAVGINVKLGIHEFGSYANNNFYMDVPNGLYMLGWGGSGTFVPDLHFQPTLTTGGSFSKISDPALDKLVEQGANSFDEAERTSVFGEAQQRTHDQAHRLFLHQQFNIYGISKSLQGWNPRPDLLLDFSKAELGDS